MKKIEGVPGYLIFFDNIRVDPFVKGFSTTISNDGAINRANIEMIFLPELDVLGVNASDGTVDFEDSIDNMTNVKIFVKNIFNNKYTSAFDGNIRSKNVSDGPNGGALSYSAVDHMESLNKTVAPLAIPYQDQLGITQSGFKLKAQAINTSAVPVLQTNQMLDFKGKTISQVLSKVENQALKSNNVYNDAGGVLYWNDVMERVDLMGDIDPTLNKSDALDLKINPDALNVDTMYVVLNDILQRLMFEFYEDRDGAIRIKPPFWNENVLLNHIIDDSIIVGFTKHSSWESLYSRVITTGGVQNIQRNITDNDDVASTLLIPMGAYVGENKTSGRWADVRFLQSGGSSNENTLLTPSTFEKKYGVSIFDNVQPLIKFATQNSMPNNSAYDALEKYSMFMFNMLNSMAETASVELIGAPWLRPGMNCWLSPNKIDKVYYIASVSHNGDPQNGVYTSVRLIHGRNSKDFFLGDKGIFGAMDSSKDNIFVNATFKKPDAFGPVIGSAQSYKDIKKKAFEFHADRNDGIIKADKDPYLFMLYGSSGKNDYGYANFTSSKAASVIQSKKGTLSDFLFSSDMTLQQIDAVINVIYTKAPNVVKNRAARIKNATEMAKKNAYRHYIQTAFKKQ